MQGLLLISAARIFKDVLGFRAVAIDEALAVLPRLELLSGHLHAAMGFDRVEADLCHEPLSPIELNTIIIIEVVILFICIFFR